MPVLSASARQIVCYGARDLATFTDLNTHTHTCQSACVHVCVRTRTCVCVCVRVCDFVGACVCTPHVDGHAAPTVSSSRMLTPHGRSPITIARTSRKITHHRSFACTNDHPARPGTEGRFSRHSDSLSFLMPAHSRGSVVERCFLAENIIFDGLRPYLRVLG